MNVLSLFDGMSCGHLALDRAGISVDKYYASEIDKYAMQVTNKNYPETVQLGSIIDLTREQLLELGEIDLLIGGSPCQGFSLAGKLKGSSTKEGVDVTSLSQYLELKELGFEFEGQSYLFWEFVRVWKIVKPKYFLLENVRVTKKWLPMFNEAMGVEPIMINSALVSAQNRVRFYWTNIPNVTHPKDKGILLRDILESDVDEKYNLSEKANMRCINNPRSRAFKEGQEKSGALLANQMKQSTDGLYAIRPCELRDYKEDSLCHHIADATDIKGNESIKRVYADSGKSPTLTTMQGGHRQPKVLSSEATYRKLTPLECERLQTVPDGYTDSVSNSQRYKMLGNGWTVDVIAHIFKEIHNDSK